MSRLATCTAGGVYVGIADGSHPMSYASVMVPVDPSPTAVHRIKLASSLADRFGARLIGVAALSFVEAQIMEDDRRGVGEGLAEAQAVFRHAAGARNSIEWRSAVAEPGAYLSEQARAADLVVVSRHDPSVTTG